MKNETIEKAIEWTVAVAIGASCMIMGPLFRSLTARPVRVLITGAAGGSEGHVFLQKCNAGHVGYALAPMIAKGEIFGRHVPVHLHLFDVPNAEASLLALKMELEDSAFPLLQGNNDFTVLWILMTDLVASTDETEAFQGVEVAILIAGYPFMAGMRRSHIIEKNIEMYKRHGIVLSEVASKRVKVK